MTEHILSENKSNGYIFLTPPPSVPHTTSLIFLHGLGDSAQGFVDVFTQLKIAPLSCKVILPTAPVQPVTVNMGMKMPSWYDFGFPKEAGPGAENEVEAVRDMVN